MTDSPLSKVPKFLKRLFREASELDNTYIAWDDSGERIRILNKEMFIKNSLPILSKTKEYSAFIRQLNNYGFVKLKSDKSEDIEEYYNPFFKKDQPRLMGFIKRVSKASKIETALNWPTIENSISYLTNANYRMGNEILHLKERIDKQDQTINGLVDILSRVFRTGLQNINTEPSYNNQNIDTFLNYRISDSNRKQNEMFSLKEASFKNEMFPLKDASPKNEIFPLKEASPKNEIFSFKEDSPKNLLPSKKDEKTKPNNGFPDMSDIFF